MAPRPLYDVITRGGGGRIDKRARWTLGRWLKLLPVMAPVIIERLYRRWGNRCGSIVPQTGDRIPGFAQGAAAQLSLGSIRGTNGIFGFVMLVMVAAVAARGEQLRDRRMKLFLGNNAAAGALIRASSRIHYSVFQAFGDA